MQAYLPAVAMVIALLLGVPIAIALAASGMLGIWLITGEWSRVMGIIGLAPFSTVGDFAMTTIPMFVLMGAFLVRSVYSDGDERPDLCRPRRLFSGQWFKRKG